MPALCRFLILPLLGALAQQPAETPPEKAIIEGMVVRAGAGEPLKKARVMLRKIEGRDPPYGAVSDAAGRFAIPNIEPGRYRLSAERNGYLRQEYGQRSANYRQGTTLTLERGQRLRDIVFRLIAAAVISGRVLDEDNEPISSVRVQALRRGWVRGQRQLVPASAAGTNDLGEFRLFGLPPGRYYLNATYTAGTIGLVMDGPTTREFFSDAAPEEGYAPTYYPGTNDPEQATALEVTPGAELRGIDFRLLPTRAVRVRGRVLIDGRPARNTMVWLQPQQSLTPGYFGSQRGMVFGDQGVFEIRTVPPGTYILSAEFRDEGKRYSARIPLDVGNSHIDGITVILQPGLELTGQVRVEGEGQFSLTDLHAYLEPQGMNTMGGGGSGRLKADGSFVLQGVSPDRYLVHVSGVPQDFYLKSARLGDEEVLETGLDLTRVESASGRLELVLSGGAGRVEGVVVDDKKRPFSGAQVVLVPESRRRSQNHLYKVATSDQNGHFALRGIRPGEYKLFAWEDIEPGAYQDPDLLRAHEERATMCRLEAGSSQDIEVSLISADQTPR